MKVILNSSEVNRLAAAKTIAQVTALSFFQLELGFDNPNSIDSFQIFWDRDGGNEESISDPIEPKAQEVRWLTLPDDEGKTIRELSIIRRACSIQGSHTASIFVRVRTVIGIRDLSFADISWNLVNNTCEYRVTYSY